MDQPEERAPGADVREALYDLQRYLSDAIPPLMVSESMELLTHRAPELTASQIHSWVGAQNRGAGVAVPVSDYFFHAIKKIHLLGEYDLIPRESLRRFVYEVSRIVLPYCPAEDRELLRANLQRLGETDAVLSTTPEFLYRQIGSSEAPLATRLSKVESKEGEAAPGDVCVASAVLDSENVPVASISASGWAGKVDIRRVGPAVHTAALSVSRVLASRMS